MTGDLPHLVARSVKKGRGRFMVSHWGETIKFFKKARSVVDKSLKSFAVGSPDKKVGKARSVPSKSLIYKAAVGPRSVRSVQPP